MKKSLIIIISVFFTAISMHAQKPIDSEMQHLMDIVATLRSAPNPEKAWNNVSEELSKDPHWTIMDEVVSHKNECSMLDRSVQWFALNRILSQRMEYEDNKTRGDFNNGEDPNFDYSLIERSVKKGCSVEYEIRSREGAQVFVIMPFNPDQSQLEANVYRGEELLARGELMEDGSIILKIGTVKKIVPNETLRLTVLNNGDQNVAFVIFNHNRRK